MKLICRKFLSACEYAESFQEQLASGFLVSVGWAKEISAQCKGPQLEALAELRIQADCQWTASTSIP
jgi:hypothetical protein